jgi:hypothetical protein
MTEGMTSTRLYVRGGNPRSRYKYGERTKECVQAYNEYMREYMRTRYRNRKHAQDEQEPLELFCRNPDGNGKINRRCCQIIAAPKGESAPRQCPRAAKLGASFCDKHLE